MKHDDGPLHLAYEVTEVDLYRAMSAMPGYRAERLRWPVAILIMIVEVARQLALRFDARAPLVFAGAIGLGLGTVYLFYARRHALSRRVFAMLSDDERRIQATLDPLGFVLEDGGGRRTEHPWGAMQFAVAAPEAIYVLDENGQIFLFPERGAKDFEPVARLVIEKLVAGAAAAKKHLNRAVTGDVILWMLLVGLGMILSGPR